MLITCKDCQKQISASATACPHCGRPVKADNTAAKWTIAIIAGVGLGLLFLFFLTRVVFVVR